MATVNGRVCRVYASETLTGDPDVVPDVAMLSPMLHAVAVKPDAPNAKVRLCRNEPMLDVAARNQSALEVVASVIAPIDFLSDDALDYADMSKRVLLHRTVCSGDVIAVSLQFWIAIEIVDGNGPVTSETAVALRVTGPRSKGKVTKHMREWAKLFWGRQVRRTVSVSSKHLEFSLELGNGMVALQGFRNDVRDVLASVDIGRSVLTIDGRCSVNEAMEAIANVTVAESPEGILICDGFSGVDGAISDLLIRATYTETAESYIRFRRGCQSVEKCSVRVVLMCSDVRDLDEKLVRSIGHQIRVEPADVSERSSIIRDVLSFSRLDTQNEKFSTEEDESSVSKMTSSSAEDLEKTIESLTRMSVGFSRNEIDGLAKVYVDRGMVGVQKAIKLFGKGQVSIDSRKIMWEDIGGLEDAKRQISELLSLRGSANQSEDDVKSSEGRNDYKNLKTMGRTGILLYGPPGTGKTLLARAVAGEASCSFMSVKGPELLDMYVGESEHNVRKVFANAVAAAPCVVFFDELDALAPARGRGSDSGGVSDRVVSQMMAELDAVNQRGDIFVIGASNRPDLVDASLLRPGRFDKLVYVPMAETREAQEVVLRAQTRKFAFDGPVDFGEILNYAPPPPALSGADLYALSADAWLRSVKRVTVALEEETETTASSSAVDFLRAERRLAAAWESIDVALESWPNVSLKQFHKLENEALGTTPVPRSVQVSQEDFVCAAKNILPSLSEEENRQYEQLRRRLQSHQED